MPPRRGDGRQRVTDSLNHVIVPGNANLQLKGGKTYTVFLEDRSVVNGKIFTATNAVSGLSCQVKSMPGGDAIALRKPGVSETYEFGAQSGHSVLEFTSLRDGTYAFGCDYEGGTPGPQAVMAVGSGVVSGIFLVILKCFGVFAVGGGVCLAIMLTVIIKRSGERKRLGQNLRFGI
ncbi:MAG TPA: hypothetical protein VKE70_29760 [Candidatus Solibacter sp.]|nr:hypothetical protein [Candidatus Solibacter sp.]